MMTDPKTSEFIDEQWAELSARANLMTALLAYSEANTLRSRDDVRKRDIEVARLHVEVHKRDVETVRLHGEVHKRAVEIERLHGEVHKRDADIERLHSEVHARDVEILRLNEEIRSILISTSWRLTAPARSLMTWINNAFHAK